ncbi:MAG: ribosome biogenesis GTPase Der [Vicinamibacterales bacterium]
MPHGFEHRIHGQLGLDFGNLGDSRHFVDDVDLDHSQACSSIRVSILIRGTYACQTASPSVPVRSGDAVAQPSAPTVVFVGRPNVGKSTLFNRLTGTRRSIVAPIAGTTRDVITHPAVWEERPVTLTDTGGMFGASQDPLHALVVDRGKRALADADVVVMVADGREGLVPGDQEVAEAIRASGKRVVLAINKMDDKRAQGGALELYRLGFDPVVEVSAEHGMGVGDLTDAILAVLPEVSRATREHEPRETSVAIVGRPNAGKSSLVNLLLREERMIVSDVPGTTRDAVDATLLWHRKQFRIVDTAGIRRPGRVARSGQVETLSVMLARRAIERADVVVLVLDATEGPTDQDGAIAGAAVDAGRGIIIAANKWDLMKVHGQDGSKVFDEQVRYHLKFLDFAPILHISAKTGERAPKLLETIQKVADARSIRVPTGELNRFIEGITTAHPPVSPGTRNVRVLYAAQTGVSPPSFVLFTNVATKLHFSYMRFLENRLRDEYGFHGTPIRIAVRRRAEHRGRGRRPAGKGQPDQSRAE